MVVEGGDLAFAEVGAVAMVICAKGGDEGGNGSGTEEMRPAAGWPLVFLVIFTSFSSGHTALSLPGPCENCTFATWEGDTLTQ